MSAYVLCRYCGQFFYTDQNHETSCSHHPKLPVLIGDSGARSDHADIWAFPCCGETLLSEVIEGRDTKPEQTPGCRIGRHVRESGWKVFISYARMDEGLARILENELRRRGHRAWRDRSDMLPGKPWAETIDEAITKADHMLLLLTSRSVQSEQVNRELALALNMRRNVIPVLLEECAIPERILHVNCVDWRSEFGSGFLSTSGFDQLREALIFGSSNGPWVQTGDEELPDEVRAHTKPRATPQQTLRVKDRDGDVVAELRPRKRYRWVEGNLVTVDNVVYVIVDVLQWSPSTVEVVVERARIPTDDAGSR